MIEIPPLANLAIGIFIVIGLIVGMRLNAFIALIVAAITVSLFAPGEAATRITRVAEAFGKTAGSIGIVIGLAAVIGQCLMVSGAADRIVQAFMRLLGQKRGNIAMAGSGFVLAVPVFFDTVFYLLIPLARSMHRITKTDYLKYVLAIAAGGAATHTLVPPTPGPLIMAANFNVSVGAMMMTGVAIALPAVIAGLCYASWAQRRWPIPMRPLGSEELPAEGETKAEMKLPSLGVSILPIALPVVLISADTIFKTLSGLEGHEDRWEDVLKVTAVVGNANFALLLSAAVAMWLMWTQANLSKKKFAHLIEEALLSGGLIVLITSAGGAFGAMLKAAQVGDAVQAMFSGTDEAGAMMMLVLAFVIASLMKIAQGSSTVAMITASSMVAALVTASGDLPFHPVYLAAAVGCGSMVCSWMNDSGFWIIAKMGGLTEIEALKAWTVMFAIMGFVGMAITMILANVLPMELNPI